MDGARTGGEQRKLSSLLQGDDGFTINRILARESSVGPSSRIYYRRAEGVPFNWEKQPGTPKNLPEEILIPPLSPPPQLQSLGLPKPCVDSPKRPDHCKHWFWKKIMRNYRERKLDRVQTPKGTAGLDKNIDQRFQNGDRNSDGEFVASSNNSCSRSSSSSYSSNSRAMESSTASKESSFCCSSWNLSEILDEGNKKMYYCRMHKTAFAVENDGSILGRIPPRVSSVEQSFRSYYRSSDGIPFIWEMQPGTPKHPLANELIPPPSPPPAMQGSGLALPRLGSVELEKTSKVGSKMLKIRSWITNKKMQTTENENDGAISFRADNAIESCCPDDDDDHYQKSVGRTDSLSRSSSSSSTMTVSKINGIAKLSKLAKGFHRAQFCFSPLNI